MRASRMEKDVSGISGGTERDAMPNAWESVTASAGGVFSRVEEIGDGYVLNATASGMELVPVWQMKTDGGTWYMDLSAGRLVTVAA